MTIEEYLSSVIDSLNSEMTDDELLRISDEVSQKLCEYNYYYGERESFTTTINGLFREYISNTIDKAELFNRINEEMTLFITSVQTEETSDNNGGGGGGYRSSKSSKKEEKTDITTDVLVEDIDSANNQYKEIEQEVDSISVSGSISVSAVQTLITELKKLLDDSVKNIKAGLEDIQKILYNYLYKITGADADVIDLNIGDDGITTEKKSNAMVDNPSYKDISNLVANWRAKSPVAKADASFFRNAGYKVNDKGIVKMDDYEYDTKTGLLKNTKTNTKVYVDYFVPKTLIGSEEKLKKANTITCLAGAGDTKVSEKTGFGNSAGYKSNSIIVIPSKQG